MEREMHDHMARVISAVGNSARLRIIHRLGDGEATAGNLTALVGLDQSTVSRHPAVLRSQGMVSSRKEGTLVYFKLETPCVLDFFLCASRVLTRNSRGKAADEPFTQDEG